LRNLISNAIKFTELGGNIRVLATLKDQHVEITISDDGIGMNEEKCIELFKIASNTTTIGTANENGSGLGLVLCKEFVEKNNGTIWVKSKEGKGSDFKFTLPLNKTIK
jgi:two-component system sensor histidine kinase/response regulator